MTLQLPHGWTITDVGGPGGCKATNGTILEGYPPPAAAGPSDKFTLSTWIPAASLASASVDFFLTVTQSSSPRFSISLSDDPNSVMLATWDSRVTGGTNQSYIDLGSPFSHNTGWANIIFSVDNALPECSAAVCYSDIGPSGDIYATGGTAENLADVFDPTICFSNSPSEQSWIFQFGSALGELGLAWTTFIIGDYYDLSVAGNRRLFNTVCPNNDALITKDTTSLSPLILMHGSKDDFPKNRINNTIWVPFPALVSGPSVPACPA